MLARNNRAERQHECAKDRSECADNSADGRSPPPVSTLYGHLKDSGVSSSLAGSAPARIDAAQSGSIARSRLQGRRPQRFALGTSKDSHTNHEAKSRLGGLDLEQHFLVLHGRSDVHAVGQFPASGREDLWLRSNGQAHRMRCVGQHTRTRMVALRAVAATSRRRAARHPALCQRRTLCHAGGQSQDCE